jgi:hypothetical protein
MQKKRLPLGIMSCASAVTLTADLLSYKLSSIVLMLAAGLFSLALFMIKGQPAKGGNAK